MKKQRGRPKSLLARVSAPGATWRDIHETKFAILDGSRAWRFIVLRQLGPGSITHRAEPVVRFRNELLQQFETALVTGDDDFLNDLAKAIRGEAQPEPHPKFTTNVLELLQKKPSATASDIFAALESDGLIVARPSEKQPNGYLKVADRKFEKKQRALDAINDIAKKVNHELVRRTNE
jgi:hypothetical protein